MLKTFFAIKGKIFYNTSKLEGVSRKLLDITKFHRWDGNLKLI